jgi:hypothetical protein
VADTSFTINDFGSPPNNSQDVSFGASLYAGAAADTQGAIYHWVLAFGAVDSKVSGFFFSFREDYLFFSEFEQIGYKDGGYDDYCQYPNNRLFIHKSCFSKFSRYSELVSNAKFKLESKSIDIIAAIGMNRAYQIVVLRNVLKETKLN